MTATDHESEYEDRPWEAPGAFRRDCAPHRAHLIKLLGTLSMSCGIGSLCFGITAVGGLILGIIAYCLGKSDLRKMSAGLMDPRGQSDTLFGQDCGLSGVMLSGFFGLIWAWIWFTVR